MGVLRERLEKSNSEKSVFFARVFCFYLFTIKRGVFMSENTEQNDENLPATTSNSNEIVPLGNLGELDLSSLPEADRNLLIKKFAEGNIDAYHLAQELGIETQAINQKMTDAIDKVKEATSIEASATITGSYNDKMGRTEVIMGNTETAAKGKLDRSQKGESDQTLVYFVIAAVVIVIIAAIVMGS